MASLRMIAKCSILRTSESERRQLIFWEPGSFASVLRFTTNLFGALVERVQDRISGALSAEPLNTNQSVNARLSLDSTYLESAHSVIG